MTYLVTGGAGFIGSHMVDRLVADGHGVIIVDDFSTGREENIAKYSGKGQVNVCRQSICGSLDNIFQQQKIDAVFHLAALPRVQFSIRNPQATHEANVNGTLNLLEACRKFGVKRFVFSSSSSVYGDQDTLPLTETMTPNPMSPYALHKLIGEYYCRLYHQLYGLETVSLRYFNVYGARQNPDGDYACLIPKFIFLIAQGETPTINGDGQQTRDFTYVSDVVEANVLAATTAKANCFGEAFNIGAGSGLSVNEVTDTIAKLIGKNITPKHGPAVIEPKHTTADIKKSGGSLRWKPGVEFLVGLKTTYEYFQK